MNRRSAFNRPSGFGHPSVANRIFMGGGTPPDPGPFVSEDLVIRLETNTNATYPIVVTGANVDVWPNRSQYGATYDAIPLAPVAALTLGTDSDGLPYVGSDDAITKRILSQRVQAAIWNPPIGTTFAPCDLFLVTKLVAAASGQFRATAVTIGGIGILFQFFIPVSTAFLLTSQYAQDAGANVQTVADLTGFLSNRYVLLRYSINGSGAELLSLNGYTVALTASSLNPTNGATPLQANSYVLGNPTSPNITEAVNQRYRAFLNYRVLLTDEQAAPTTSYLMGEYT